MVSPPSLSCPGYGGKQGIVWLAFPVGSTPGTPGIPVGSITQTTPVNFPWCSLELLSCTRSVTSMQEVQSFASCYSELVNVITPNVHVHDTVRPLLKVGNPR